MSGGHAPYFIDPELTPHPTPDAQMYALADGALQAHQEQHHLAGHFAGLVEAATAAAGEAEQHTGLNDLPPLTQKRNTRKRKRVGQDGEQDPDDQDAGDLDPPIASSASALFRRPASTAKKYTRPPMSKLFSSLQLSPENFLQLQSAAKGYMLDPAHPQRQDTVGQRGRGDSELVKLRLFNCVKDFLENHGNGLQYFGPDVPGDEGQKRTMIWPQDKNDIISAVIPLMRRMVTNERQRQYAVETRKGGRNGTDADNTYKQYRAADAEAEMSLHDADPVFTRPPEVDGDKSIFEALTGCQPKEYVVGPTYDWPMLQLHVVNILPKMGLPESDAREVVSSLSYHFRYTHREGFMFSKTRCSHLCLAQLLDHIVASGRLDHGSWQCSPQDSTDTKHKKMKSILKELANTIKAVISKTELSTSTGTVPKDANGEHAFPVMIRVNLVRNGERIRAYRDVGANSLPYRHSLLQDAVASLGPNDVGTMTVKALCPEGLVTVDDDTTWQRCKKLAAETVWMDGEMKVIVEIS